MTPRPWRTVHVVAVGTLAGAAGVVAARAALGPGSLAVAAAAGGGALLLGVVLAVRHRGRVPGGVDGVPAGLRLHRRARPVGWPGAVFGSVLAVAAWATVAHSSGSGWVQAIGAVLAAVLLTGLAAPAAPARRATATCTASPGDARAGRPFTLTVEVGGPLRVHPRYPAGPLARAVGGTRGARTVEVTCTADRRGVLDVVVLELASCAPFGLLWWAKDVVVPLTRPLHVAPRTGATGALEADRDDHAGEAPVRTPAGIGEPHGVRPYVAGDARRAVHWPATAHAGTLMVRESERRVDEPLVVDLVLPDDPSRAEAETERAMATVGAQLAAGRTVLLGTTEATGPVRRAVRDRVDLGRRLARAVADPGTGRAAGRGPAAPASLRGRPRPAGTRADVRWYDGPREGRR